MLAGNRPFVPQVRDATCGAANEIYRRMFLSFHEEKKQVGREHRKVSGRRGDG